VVAGGDVAASGAHGGQYAIQVFVDGLWALGEDAFVDAAGEDQIGVALAYFDDVAAGGHFKGAHDIHADGFLIKIDNREAVSVGVDLDIELTCFV